MLHLCEQYLLILAGQDVGHTQVGQDHSAHIQDLQWDTQTHTHFLLTLQYIYNTQNWTNFKTNPGCVQVSTNWFEVI